MAEDESLRLDQPEVPDEAIEARLDLMTRMNRKSKRLGQMDFIERTTTCTLYSVALEWLTGHNISFTYDSKQRRYVRN